MINETVVQILSYGVIGLDPLFKLIPFNKLI